MQKLPQAFELLPGGGFQFGLAQQAGGVGDGEHGYAREHLRQGGGVGGVVEAA